MNSEIKKVIIRFYLFITHTHVKWINTALC